MNEENTSIENTAEKNEQLDERVIEETKALTIKSQRLKKHLEAKKLVDEARSIVNTTENEMHDCRLLLKEDLEEYEIAKTELKIGGLDDAKTLLLELDSTVNLDKNLEEDSIVFEAKEDVKPIVLKDVRSGKFTAMMLSFIAGVVFFIGLIYVATEKLSMTLDISKIPSSETMMQIVSWFSTLIGVENNASVGIALLVLGTVLIMSIVYLIRVRTKANSNLRFANKQMKDAQIYVTSKTNCKVEMERVDEHITDAINTLKEYQILLNEQNGKLKRILYFEGEQSNPSSYHAKSVDTIKDTQSLLEHIQRFMSIPMSEEGKLSGKSTLFLHSAKENIQKTLSKWI